MDNFEPDTYDYYKEKIIFAISVHSLECWLLAYHGSKKCKITGCDAELTATMQIKKKKLSTLNKDVRQYIEHSLDFKKRKNHPPVAAKSISFEKFIQQLSAIKIKGIYYFIPNFDGFSDAPFLRSFG